MKRYFLQIIFLCSFMSILIGCAKEVSEPVEQEAQNETQSIHSRENIIAMHEDIIKLQERILRDTEIKIQSGKATLIDYAKARANLAEYNIELAQMQKRDDLVLQELQNLVQFYMSTKEKLVEQLDSGKGLSKDLYELEIMLLQANIRLSEIVLQMKASNIL